MNFAVKSYSGLAVLVSYETQKGNELAKDIVNYITLWDSPVTVDFSAIRLATAIFLRLLLFELYGQLGIEKVNKLVQFINLNDLNKRGLELTKKHVVSYLTDPLYKDAVDSVTSSIYEDA